MSKVRVKLKNSLGFETSSTENQDIYESYFQDGEEVELTRVSFHSGKLSHGWSENNLLLDERDWQYFEITSGNDYLINRVLIEKGFTSIGKFDYVLKTPEGVLKFRSNTYEFVIGQSYSVYINHPWKLQTLIEALTQ